MPDSLLYERAQRGDLPFFQCVRPDAAIPQSSPTVHNVSLDRLSGKKALYPKILGSHYALRPDTSNYGVCLSNPPGGCSLG